MCTASTITPLLLRHRATLRHLNWVARHYRHPLLIFVVSDEPEIDDGLSDYVRLTARHDVMWAMVADMAARVS